MSFLLLSAQMRAGNVAQEWRAFLQLVSVMIRPVFFCAGGIWASTAHGIILNRTAISFPDEVEAYKHQLLQNKISLQVCPMAHIWPVTL